MNSRSISLAVLVAVAATSAWAQGRHAPSAPPAGPEPGAPEAPFVASTAKSFDQLMDDAMRVMHRDMHNGPLTGDHDRDFVAMMIPHHQGAIDMAKVLLLYGEDEQLRRLAQEIIADQQNEVQLMRLWLAKHPQADSGRQHENSATRSEHCQ